jgi:hypothetical protein
MLDSVNASKARSLVNVDEHSDLADRKCDRFNCGTWVSYVVWRHEGSYTWIRNSRSTAVGNCNGCCSGDDNWDYDSDWRTRRSIFRKPKKDSLETLLTRDVVDVGICISPGYTNERLQRVTREIFRDLIPLKRGVSNELRWNKILSVAESDKLWDKKSLSLAS